jgi:uncharacterized membrane protein YedE/YeeE
MTEFTPVSGLIGGMMIGLAAVLLLLLNGRIAGVTGIAGGIIGAKTSEIGWRAAFVVGLVVGPLLVAAIGGTMPAVDLTTSWPLLIVAGLLVGFGTRLGGGCTSGHGVCGMARLSPRSIVATPVFIAAAFVTVFVARHAIGG